MHFCVVKSRTLKIVFAMILVVVALSLSFNGSASAEVFFGYSTRKVPIYNVETEEKKVAITFDAAWGADKTQDILDILDEFDANATFFLVGFWVDDYPEMTKKIDEAGCEIGTHSNTHPDMAKLDKQTMKSELETSISKIKNITGKDVSLFRVKNGLIILMHNNSHVLDALRLLLTKLKVQGYKVTNVSEVIYSQDYTIDRNGVQHKN